MRITGVTPIGTKLDRESGIEVSVGDYDEVTTDWYRADINSLHKEFDAAGIEFREYTLMRKAVGAESGILMAMLIWGVVEAFNILKAWLPAREGRKVRIKFKDGTEIEAANIDELEQIRDRFLAHVPEEND